jgi:hypothetical protein
MTEPAEIILSIFAVILLIVVVANVRNYLEEWLRNKTE